jgi:hypothetical protein
MKRSVQIVGSPPFFPRTKRFVLNIRNTWDLKNPKTGLNKDCDDFTTLGYLF